MNNNFEIKNNNTQKIELDSINVNIGDIDINIIEKNDLIKYKYNDKIELVKKINKIKKKEYLINIFSIISSSTDNYTENNNGIFIFFHNLDNEVYNKIGDYVNLIYKINHQTSITNIINSDSQILNSENNNESDDDNELSLSNKEKILLRRKKYKKYLDYNQY